MSWAICSSEAAIRKAGLNANSTIVASGSALSDWSDEAESTVCDIARSDVVTNFASITAKGKELLQQYCTASVAQNIIGYDMSGYTSRLEAQTMLDILENQKSEAEKQIKESKVWEYLGVT